MDNFFTSPGLLRHIRENSIAVTETVQTCWMENSPLKLVGEVGETERGSSDVAVQTSSNIVAIRCKDNKVLKQNATV